MDFCLSGKGSEARSSQTATRLLAVLWFESLLLVWRLHSRTIRPVARFLFAGGKGNCVLFERDLSFCCLTLFAKNDSYCWQPFPSAILISTPPAAVMVRLKHPPVKS